MGQIQKIEDENLKARKLIKKNHKRRRRKNIELKRKKPLEEAKEQER